MPRAWSLLTVLERQHGGNEGYDDKIDTYYSYDSTVPNARAVSTGDLAVLRDSTHLLGIGIISAVSSRPGTKTRRRCPECGRTGFKRRTTMLPRYRCNSGHVFDAPTEETIAVDHFRADYADTWNPLPRRLSADALEAVMVSGARQHSIRELRLDRLRTALEGIIPEELWDALSAREHQS